MTEAYVLIHCETGHEKNVFENLKKIPEIIEMWITWGSFDLICKLVTISEQSLKDIVINDVRKVPKLKETETLLVYI